MAHGLSIPGSTLPDARDWMCCTSGGGPVKAAQFWLEWRVGERVVVRHRVEGGYFDALGELNRVGGDGVLASTRGGPEAAGAADHDVGNAVPPPPAPGRRRAAYPRPALPPRA